MPQSRLGQNERHAGAGMLPTPVSISKTRRNISPPKPIANVLAAVSVENLLNVDYTKYMCWRTVAGYVVPSPGNTVKGSIRYSVKGDI